MSDEMMKPKSKFMCNQFLELIKNGKKINSDNDGAIVMTPEEAFKFMEDSGAFISWLNESVSCKLFAPDIKEENSNDI